MQEAEARHAREMRVWLLLFAACAAGRRSEGGLRGLHAHRTRVNWASGGGT